jgi:hypothetical protein
MMHITKQQFQSSDRAGIEREIIQVADKQNLTLCIIREKAAASLRHSKTHLDGEMLEKFYSRLLPVTYLDWKRSH